MPPGSDVESGGNPGRDSCSSPGFPGTIPPPPVALPRQMNAYRRLPLKEVGRDARGRVIPYEYEEATAQQIALWVAAGADENFMCVALNMRPGTLKELYGQILEHGKTAVNMNVAAAAYRDSLMPGAHAQQKFWLKSRAGWRDGESQPTDVSPLSIIIHS